MLGMSVERFIYYGNSDLIETSDYYFLTFCASVYIFRKGNGLYPFRLKSQFPLDVRQRFPLINQYVVDELLPFSVICWPFHVTDQNFSRLSYIPLTSNCNSISLYQTV